MVLQTYVMIYHNGMFPMLLTWMAYSIVPLLSIATLAIGRQVKLGIWIVYSLVPVPFVVMSLLSWQWKKRSLDAWSGLPGWSITHWYGWSTRRILIRKRSAERTASWGARWYVSSAGEMRIGSGAGLGWWWSRLSSNIKASQRAQFSQCLMYQVSLGTSIASCRKLKRYIFPTALFVSK